MSPFQSMSRPTATLVNVGYHGDFFQTSRKAVHQILNTVIGECNVIDRPPELSAPSTGWKTHTAQPWEQGDCATEGGDGEYAGSDSLHYPIHFGIHPVRV